MGELFSKYAYALLLLCVTVGYASAQPRVNKVFDTKLVATTLPLRGSTIKGYHYSEARGKWDEALGKIPGALTDSEFQHFKTMDAKKVEYDDSVYYVVGVKQMIGHWEYPRLKRGYYESLDETLFYFREKEFLPLFNLSNGQVIQLYPYYIGFGALDKESLDAFSLSVEYPSGMKFYSWVIKLSDEGLIRFMVPERIRRNFKLEDLNTDYFEVTAEKFYKWLEPVMLK